MDFPGGSDGKEFACNARDPGLIPGSERSLGEGIATHSNILVWRIPWIGMDNNVVIMLLILILINVS